MDPAGWKFVIDDADVEDANSRNASLAGRRCVLFAVDCGRSMFQSAGGQCPFKISLEVARNMYSQKCVTWSADYVSLVLYNTGLTKNDHEFRSVSVLHKLGLPDADKVKQLESLLTETADGEFKNFQNVYGSGKAAIDEVLWLISMLFGECKVKRLENYVFLFTSCDDPCGKDRALKKRTVQKLRDLKERNVFIEVMPVGSTPFDWDKLYRVSFPDEQLPKTLPSPSKRCAELLSRVATKDRKRRTYATLKFSIGLGVDISVSLCSVVTTTSIPAVVKLDGRTNVPVASVTSFVDPKDNKKLNRSDVCRYQTFGGRRIALSFEEFGQLSRLCPTGLLLIGFVTRKRVKLHHFVQHALFMQPDERTVKGSSTLFNALLEKCTERKVVPICRMSVRRNVSPRIVALLPQGELRDREDSRVFCDAGFHVIILPYEEDLRDVSTVTAVDRPVVDDPQMADVMRKIVADLQPPIPLGLIHNPALQKHYKALEAFALDREQVEAVPDETLPDVQQMDAKLVPLLTTNVEAPVALRAMADQGSLNRLTVTQLKRACQAEGIRLRYGTRKADVVRSITDHYRL